MKKYSENIFYKNYPTIDLHGMTRDIASVYINDFINENLKLKNEFLVIIHGKGEGILAKQTEYILSSHKYVKEFKKDNFNLGTTLVKLSVDKIK